MSDWLETARTNLLRLSQEAQDFPAALREWEHTGRVLDHGAPLATCQLCEHERLRYHFEIRNRCTAATLLVGSSCITRFDIAVYDDRGQALSGPAKEERLKDKVREQQREARLAPLRELYRVAEAERGIIRQTVLESEARRGFSPAQLLTLFRQMDRHGIRYQPTLYKVRLRSEFDQQQLLRLSAEERVLLWPCLSVQQRRRFGREPEPAEPQPPTAPPPTAPPPPAVAGPFAEERARWHAAMPPSAYEFEEGTCTICGKKTRDWVTFDGATKQCKCRDCFSGRGPAVQ